MADFVLKDAVITINAVNLSAWCRSATINLKADEKEDTNMGDSTHIRIAGLKDWSLSATFSQDFASGGPDATLAPLIGAAAFAVKLRPTSSAVSATNPEYQGNAILTSYSPIDGGVGDEATCTVDFAAASDLTRAVA